MGQDAGGLRCSWTNMQSGPKCRVDYDAGGLTNMQGEPTCRGENGGNKTVQASFLLKGDQYFPFIILIPSDGKIC